ncbi:MAG TPA: superoxide dismutase family protein [Firmicutes bacterium]|nr:superoxide dismutase family protein [Bacillota bacterium]
MYYDKRAKAIATIKGGPIWPQVEGTACFLDAPLGTYIVVHVEGLPPYQRAEDSQSPIGPLGFHIHEGNSCEIGDPDNPFLDARGHYNPDNQPHGNHAGDLPVLFSMDGKAIMVFYTNRFTPEEVIGRTILIHQNPDDYRTQPAGNSGLRLACGRIVRNY